MAAELYKTACRRDQIPEVMEVVQALESGATKELTLSHRRQPLGDLDACCIAEALTMHHTIRVLDLEENKIGAQGVQALLDAFNVNPGFVRELRLGKNNLRDPPVVALGNALSVEGAGLKVVDLSQNNITKLGAQAISHALASRTCDLVEVSFHCNDLDADAGLYLAQGVRASSRLKHLHLGYNSLRCGGTTHLARCLPIARSLLTLDLTANRIGTQGGADLVKALLSDSCHLQRLNLRHNNLDDDTIAQFAQVIERSGSLQQLFLGYMNPSFETAELILSTLATKNTSLICFDCYGWKLQHQAGPVPAVDDIMRNNTILRALVTDHDFGAMADEGNQFRAASGLHELYIGGDDRLAAQSTLRHTQALRQQASQSRSLPQQHADPARTESPSSRPTSTSPRRNPPVATGQRNGSPQSRGIVHAHNAPNNKSLGSGDEDLDQLVTELDTIPCDPDLRNHLALIIAQLQLKMEVQRSHHQQQITLLEERVRSLERQREDDKEDCSRRCASLVHQQLKKEGGIQNQNQQQHQQPRGSTGQTTPRDAHNTSVGSTGSRQQHPQANSIPFKPASAYPSERNNRESPAKPGSQTNTSPQRQQPMFVTAEEAPSSRNRGSVPQAQGANNNRQSMSEPSQRPTSPAKNLATQPRSNQGGPGARSLQGQPSSQQRPDSPSGPVPVTVGNPTTRRERNDAAPTQPAPAAITTKAQSPQRTVAYKGTSASPDPRGGSNTAAPSSPATAGGANNNPNNNRAGSPPVRPQPAATGPLIGPDGKPVKEGSHGPGDGVVLSVPRHPEAEAKVEHSPAPINEERSGTPDLQTSHHGQGQAAMAPPPQKSSAPARPKGTRAVPAQDVVAQPTAFTNTRK